MGGWASTDQFRLPRERGRGRREAGDEPAGHNTLAVGSEAEAEAGREVHSSGLVGRKSRFQGWCLCSDREMGGNTDQQGRERVVCAGRVSLSVLPCFTV